jgi:hypothetical protein
MIGGRVSHSPGYLKRVRPGTAMNCSRNEVCRRDAARPWPSQNTTSLTLKNLRLLPLITASSDWTEDRLALYQKVTISLVGYPWFIYQLFSHPANFFIICVAARLPFGLETVFSSWEEQADADGDCGGAQGRGCIDSGR